MFGSKKKIESLENAIKEQKMRNEQYVKEIMLLKTQLKAAEYEQHFKEIAELKNVIQEIQSENQALIASNEHKQKNIEVLEDKLCLQNNGYKETINQYKKNIEENEYKKRLLEDEIEILRNEISSLKTSAENIEQEIVAYQNNSETLQKKYWQINEKYRICKELLAKNTLGFILFNRNPQIALELVESEVIETLEKKNAYAKLCNILEKIARKDA